MTEENIMSIIGKVVFATLCGKYKNDPDIYLKILLYDRTNPPLCNSGFDCMEYGIATRGFDKECFLNQINIEDVLK